MKYRKKPVVIEATPWWKNGDHPQDNAFLLTPKDRGYTEKFDLEKLPSYLSEGAIVRYYRRPEGNGQTICSKCSRIMHDHGWIDTLEGGHIVCPGDWVITGIKGEYYSCKPDIFEATYEPVT